MRTFFLTLAVAAGLEASGTTGVQADEVAAPIRCSVPGGVCELHGKVQIVSSFATYKVQIVNAFPDLKVQKVTSFPDKGGQWQLVSSFPDFTIQLVDAFPDFKIQYVSSFPGCR